MAVYHVYILASASGVLYTGITNFLERRVRQHKQKLVDGFTKQYDDGDLPESIYHSVVPAQYWRPCYRRSRAADMSCCQM